MTGNRNHIANRSAPAVSEVAKSVLDVEREQARSVRGTSLPKLSDDDYDTMLDRLASGDSMLSVTIDMGNNPVVAAAPCRHRQGLRYEARCGSRTRRLHS
jgi:hypothetical protein